MFAPTLSAFAPSQHNIQRAGIGYAGVLTMDQLRKAAPSAFAEQAHNSRSDRYAYLPTVDLIQGMQSAGFLPVQATQTRSRTLDKREHAKHMIRFRREDQLAQAEAREVILINSHDGSSAYKLSAGIFRLVCSNGLIVGNEDTRQTVRHSGDALGEVIEGACRIVEDFELIASEIDVMKGTQLEKPLMLAFANAAIEARFPGEQKPVTPDQILRPRRVADVGSSVWETFNRIQENVIKGGLQGHTKDALGRTRARRTREVKGIDQNDALNRALWVLGMEVAKLAK